MKNKPRYNRRLIKDRDVKSKDIDVRPLDKRESPLNGRKGMNRTQETPVNINWLEKQQLLFDNSQRNCNGYSPEVS